LTHYVVRRFTC